MTLVIALLLAGCAAPHPSAATWTLLDGRVLHCRATSWVGHFGECWLGLDTWLTIPRDAVVEIRP